MVGCFPATFREYEQRVTAQSGNLNPLISPNQVGHSREFLGPAIGGVGPSRRRLCGAGWLAFSLVQLECAQALNARSGASAGPGWTCTREPARGGHGTWLESIFYLRGGCLRVKFGCRVVGPPVPALVRCTCGGKASEPFRGPHWSEGLRPHAPKPQQCEIKLKMIKCRHHLGYKHFS
jgi:hypothetical protein